MEKKLNDYIEQISKSRGRKISICLFGYGSTNQAIHKIVSTLPCCNKITIRQTEENNPTAPTNTESITGESAFIIHEDVVFASPSLRRDRLTIPDQTIITSDTEIFFNSKPDNLFCISGSDGKSTVTTLTSLLLSDFFTDHFLGGNLGRPIATADLNSPAFVLELSSFNLFYLLPNCKRAIITNLTPNHLDWHKSEEEYRETKIRLLHHSSEPIITLGSDFLDREAKGMSSFALVSDTMSDSEIRQNYDTKHTVSLNNDKIHIDGVAILDIKSVRRNERHNLRNLMSAIAMSIGYASKEKILDVASTFEGLKNRCQTININGTDYINSSIDTTPERTKTTLTGLRRRVNIILGGRGKHLSYEPLREPLSKYANRISLYGEAAKELDEWLDSVHELSKIPRERFSTLCQAIEFASENVTDKVAVLLSPAATSYGEFENFEQRGAYFLKYVSELHKP